MTVPTAAKYSYLARLLPHSRIAAIACMSSFPLMRAHYTANMSAHIPEQIGPLCSLLIFYLAHLSRYSSTSEAFEKPGIKVRRRVARLQPKISPMELAHHTTHTCRLCLAASQLSHPQAPEKTRTSAANQKHLIIEREIRTFFSSSLMSRHSWAIFCISIHLSVCPLIPSFKTRNFML